MPPDMDKYQRSQIDWERLSAYAHRVARETSKPKHTKVVTEQGQRPKTVYKERLFRSPIPYTVMESYAETKHVSTDYWVLERRYRTETTIHQRDPNFHRVIETEYTEFCLADDGTLFTHRWEEVEKLQILGGGKTPINDHHTYSPSARESLTDRDVMLFDHWPYNKPLLRRGNATIETNGQFLSTGLRLRRHAKGVGLSKALGTFLK